MDNLFIDEGFGTLSENKLDEVMDAFANLDNSRGLKIGLISHVKSLQESIPIRIETTNKSGVSSLEIKSSV